MVTDIYLASITVLIKHGTTWYSSLTASHNSI